MIIIDEISLLRQTTTAIRSQGQTLAFVPTMGNLHEGHLSLVRQAKACCDQVIVSIFVNPLQFGPSEDLATYPRTMEQDLLHLRELGVDIVFTPTEEVLFPRGRNEHTKVSIPGLNAMHCGASRPQFFDGVATIVTKLFNIVQADVAIFGEKDYQQLLCIRRLVQDLCLPIEIKSGAIVREADGLAMSSRNKYLTAKERDLAPYLQQTLLDSKRMIEAGNEAGNGASDNNWQAVSEAATARLNKAGFKVDYFNICHAETLEAAKVGDEMLVILAAAWLGKARLIDNIVIS